MSVYTVLHSTAHLVIVVNKAILLSNKYIYYIFIAGIRARNFFLGLLVLWGKCLNFSLVLTPVELVLKSGILKETKHIIQ